MKAYTAFGHNLSQWIKLQGAGFCQERPKDRQGGREEGKMGEGKGKEGKAGEGKGGDPGATQQWNGTPCAAVSSPSDGESNEGLGNQL